MAIVIVIVTAIDRLEYPLINVPWRLI